MNYCTIEDVENYLLQEIQSSFEPQVEVWIGGISRLMDTLSNRTLVAQAVGSGEDFPVKYYDGNDKEYIYLDDCQEIDKLSIGDYYGDSLTEVSIGSYITKPRIAPYSAIVLKNGFFTEGIQNIKVEGRFGLFNELPDDIRLACTILVAGVINASNPTTQNKKSESIGNYSVSYTDDKGIADFNRAKAIIESYRKLEL